MGAAGIDALWDDRDESAGVKFNDADLMGMPVRVTVSGRSLQRGGVEIKLRSEEERRLVSVEEAVAEVREMLGALASGIRASLVEERLVS